MVASEQMRLLLLEPGAKLDENVHRLSIGWKLCFGLSPVLHSQKVRLFCTYPCEDGGGYIHSKGLDKYFELMWTKSSNLWEGYGVVSNWVVLKQAGAYRYFFTIDGSDRFVDHNGCGYFIVDPQLHVGKDDRLLPLDAVQLQTVLSKLLGPFEQWKDRLIVSRESGYNMMHFTPIQKLNGISNSSYSISDQLQLNPVFDSKDKQCQWEDIDSLVRFMKDEWDTLCLTDLVLNHTANDSPWLLEHSECAYNLCNSPHLKPAFLLDRAIYYASIEIAKGRIMDKFGVPAEISCETHLQALKTYLREQIVQLRLEEFYLLDVDRVTMTFQTALEEVLRCATLKELPLVPKSGCTVNSLQIVQDAEYRRMESSIDCQKALQLFSLQISKVGADSGKMEDVVRLVCQLFRDQMEVLNSSKRAEVASHVEIALENVLSGARYRFLNMDGPRLGSVSKQHLIVDQYFINQRFGISSTCIQDDEDILNCREHSKLIMAHNGWVMGDDPLKNFAEPGSYVYLRRELVVWGDSIKLRYGSFPADCPYLWQQMENYTCQTARIFHGIRLDNCHSTPLHVAEHMLKCARSVRPNLYVVAELFTSNETTDNVFVNRLGLNSLIREGLSAWDAHEQGRLVYKYGGRPVGSFFQPNVQILSPAVAHALFMDVTHDNESIIVKRTVLDSIALSAYVAMSSCATGSNRGYDELVPHHINVVNEKRLYQSWRSKNVNTPDLEGYCDESSGIISVKLALNKLHQHMGIKGYDQVYVHDLSKDVVSITRHHPVTHKSFICVVRSAFSCAGDRKPHCEPLVFEGELHSVWLYASIRFPPKDCKDFQQSTHFINGYQNMLVDVKLNVSLETIPGVSKRPSGGSQQGIEFQDFPVGSVLIIKVNPSKGVRDASKAIQDCVAAVHQSFTCNSSNDEGSDVKSMVDSMTLNDLNVILFRCEAEERASASGYGTYNIPQYGNLVYTGLQGIFSPMALIRAKNHLGHAICHNLRQGDWLVEYIQSRLSHYPSLQKFSEFLARYFAPLKSIPRYLIPCYFDVLLVALSLLLYRAIGNKMASFVKDGSSFARSLAVSSLEFCGSVPSAQLAPVSATVLSHHVHPVTGLPDIIGVSAGLPHFAEGIMRNWGRDTFIAMRGLLLVTQRFNDARAIILSYAGTLRHGLIPNLLGEGRHARYNCRDAIWWWFQAIQDYCKMAPNGLDILQDEVLRMYPTDESEAQLNTKQRLVEIMHEAIQRHAQGIAFRERNAGTSIDLHMTDEGFNVTAGINWYTGFVVGGNSSNCGTWMDKMGSSEKAGNKGKPATPRNGSAVELVALCASAVKWLGHLHTRGRYPFAGVRAKRPEWIEDKEISFEVWYDLIRKNFEPYFWVDGTFTTLEVEPRPDLINRRNIYKDCVGASPQWADYQLRPNFPVAMVLAPGLFNSDHAWKALQSVEELLVGPLGLKTLDPTDWEYRADYVNSDDSGNYQTAAGFNYHNGPEWLWPMGFFLRAKLLMSTMLEQTIPGIRDSTIKFVNERLAFHQVALDSSPWRSLPELTNSNGMLCPDSCPAQAWSVSCIMDVLSDLDQLQYPRD